MQRKVPKRKRGLKSHPGIYVRQRPSLGAEITFVLLLLPLSLPLEGKVAREA